MNKPKSIDQNSLVEKGRLQYFYHSPRSDLPIRDVLNDQKQGNKTEPHIEIGAENYWNACYQSNNIKPFIDSNEKYLFLFTNCMNKQLPEFFNKQFIVGYIKKGTFGDSPVNQTTSCNQKVSESHLFVKGETFLYDFKDALPLTAIGLEKRVRKKNVDETNTKIILNHFKGKKNILKDCVKEIKTLDKENITCLRVYSNKNCLYKDDCLRWKS